MNRNWRVCTPEGVWALKQVLDVHADQARRQHRVTRTLAAFTAGYREATPLADASLVDAVHRWWRLPHGRTDPAVSSSTSVLLGYVC